MNSSFTTIFWTQFWQITLLIPVAVLLIRFVVPKFPHLGYGILLLVLVKTMFPPIWDSPTGVVWELIPHVESKVSTSERNPENDSSVTMTEKSLSVSQSMSVSAPSITSAKQTRPATSRQSSDVHQTTRSTNWKYILFGIWLAGVLSLLGYIFGKRAQLLRFHKDTEVPPSDELLELVENVAAELELIKIPKVLVTLHPTVPFASGFLKQIVVLPAHIAEHTDREELKLILAHEMTHLRRGDTLVGVLQLVVQVLWWFHPLVYWLNREVRRVREECCDADVVRRLNCQPARYAHCLLNMLELHQKLRPAPELVGLSPLEVTTKRMQNIMRTSAKRPHRIATIATSLLLTIFALIILPASASSYVTPKVIIGDLAPESAIVVSRAPETRPKKQPEKKTPAPKKKSRLPKNKKPSIVSPTPNRPVEKSPDQELIANFEYRWSRGDQHRYQVKIEAKYPTEIRTQTGQPIFRVDAYAAGIPALTRLNPKFEKSVLPRDGIDIPSFQAFETQDDFSSSFPYSARLPFGRPGATSRNSAPTFGSNAEINPSSGTLPYLLGQLKDWVFPALPTSINKATRIEFTREITLVSPKQLLRNPFDSLPQAKMQTEVTIQTGLVSTSPEEIILSRRWKLSSEELINGEARREVSLQGEIHLSRDTTFPISAVYTGRLVERELNREFRIPLTLEIRRAN